MAEVAAEPLGHILVVDDDERLRDLLKRFLGSKGYGVTVAENAARARSLREMFDFDLMVLDVMMPQEDGFALTASIRETSDVPILLLTARDLPEDRIEGLRRGADDYLPKPFEPEELVLRIEAILRRAGARDDALDDTPVTFGACSYDPARGELRKDGDIVRLTTSEEALLTALARQAGRPVSRLDLAQSTSAGQERTVDVQVTRLRRKIEDDPKQPLFLQTVRGAGYKLMVD